MILNLFFHLVTYTKIQDGGPRHTILVSLAQIQGIDSSIILHNEIGGRRWRGSCPRVYSMHFFVTNTQTPFGPTFFGGWKNEHVRSTIHTEAMKSKTFQPMWCVLYPEKNAWTYTENRYDSPKNLFLVHPSGRLGSMGNDYYLIIFKQQSGIPSRPSSWKERSRERWKAMTVKVSL